MRAETFSSPAFIVLLTMACLRKGHRLKSLSQIMDKSDALALNVLDFLQKDGCIRHDSVNDLWQCLPTQSCERAIDMALQFLTKDSACPLIGQALLLLQRKEVLSGCDCLLTAMDTFMKTGSSAAVLTCLDILLEQLQAFPFQTHSHENVRRYLMLIFDMQGIAMYMAKRPRESLALLSLARQAAAWLGDQRLLLLVNLLEAEQSHSAQSHNTVQPYALLNSTLENIRELGDPDILEQAAPALGTLHIMQADYEQTLKYLQAHKVNTALRPFGYTAMMTPRYIASAACFLGKFDLAVGVLESSLREARLNQHVLAAKWWQTHLADMLLRMGHTEAALEHLDAVFPCCDPESETKLWIWNARTLAYYHFQQKNIRTSHRILFEGMHTAACHGLVRPYYAFTWLFDMLLAYEQEGLPPIPNYDLEQELAAAMQSPNRQLKGAALRIRALQQRRLGAPPAAVHTLLQCSLGHATAVGNPLEVARTHLALSHCLYQLNNNDEANAAQDLARGILSAYNQYDCPAPRPGADPAQPIPRLPAALDGLASYDKELENLPAWTTLESHFQHIVDATRALLEVERIALFMLDDDKFACLAARHISLAEVGCAQFQLHHTWLLHCARQNATETQHDEHGARLCISLPMPRQKICLLFAENIYSPEGIVQQNPTVFAHLRQSLALELHTSLLVYERTQATQKAAEEKARQTAARLDAREALYYGASLQDVLRQSDQVAATDAPVLINGETGVGKEMLARRLHTHSGRSGPFVPVHPASTPESLFESEFFGHEKGAFTGAHRQKIGLFEVADKGTLFIDELGDVPPAMQTKLLRVVQEKCFLRVGGTREIASDFRLVSATNRDLKRMVHEGSFREDLYYRLSVVPLRLPPLRERPDDILPLAHFFLERFARRYQRSLPPLSNEEYSKLSAYPWPGNIREIKSLMERTVILYTGGPLSFALSTALADPGPVLYTSQPPSAGSDTLYHDLPSMEELQRRYIQHVLKLTHGRVSDRQNGAQGAAQILHMKRSTLYAKIRQYGLDSASLLYGLKEKEKEEKG